MLDFVSLAFLFGLLVLITCIDIKRMVIPDKLIIFGFVGFLLLLLIKCMYYGTLAPVLNGVLGAVAGGVPLMLVIILTRGGMGAGDMKLAAMSGAFIGPKSALLMLFIAIMTGGFYGAALILLKKKTLKSELPFGPFIALGAVISALFGEQILSRYFLL